VSIVGVTVHLRCAENRPPRRYLVLQIPRVEYLNVCEVQVFVRRTYMHVYPIVLLHSMISYWHRPVVRPSVCL